jgi:hypothetical protein
MPHRQHTASKYPLIGVLSSRIALDPPVCAIARATVQLRAICATFPINKKSFESL